MKLRRISKNVRELMLADRSRVLISYSTPVARYLPRENIIMITNKRWSNSTQGQIRRYEKSLNWPERVECEQEGLNRLLDGTGLEHEIGRWSYGQTYSIRDFNREQQKKGDLMYSNNHKCETW